jgi:hypothetical protein
MKSWAPWLLAVVITLGSAIYQRMTGPSYPVRGKFAFAGQDHRYRLIRTWGGVRDAEVRLEVPSGISAGQIFWKRFRTSEEWSRAPMQKQGNELVGRLPHQPPAGKLLYRVMLQGGDELRLERVWLGGGGVVIRFKGDVPTSVLYIHIAAMFAAMLCATRAGLELLAPAPSYRGLILASLVFFTVGGMVLGPVVQKYAFGAYWTGWPFGTDLTDNKTAVAWASWIAAFVALKHSKRPGAWVLAACLLTLAVYLIPHSMFGSELRY